MCKWRRMCATALAGACFVQTGVCEVVLKWGRNHRVAVVKERVDNRSGDRGCGKSMVCLCIEIMFVIAVSLKTCWLRLRESQRKSEKLWSLDCGQISKEEWVKLKWEERIFYNCWGMPINLKSVFDKLSVRRFSGENGGRSSWMQ